MPDELIDLTLDPSRIGSPSWKEFVESTKRGFKSQHGYSGGGMVNVKTFIAYCPVCGEVFTVDREYLSAPGTFIRHPRMGTHDAFFLPEQCPRKHDAETIRANTVKRGPLPAPTGGWTFYGPGEFAEDGGRSIRYERPKR
jgi:hypothetical protein